ncbi:MAG: hypothetical protein K0U98_00020 [Deltaproteobacteria bacterium]|nr:hypothetical protein [Deltaproteobacteria bacterium]
MQKIEPWMFEPCDPEAKGCYYALFDLKKDGITEVLFNTVKCKGKPEIGDRCLEILGRRNHWREASDGLTKVTSALFQVKGKLFVEIGRATASSDSKTFAKLGLLRVASGTLPQIRVYKAYSKSPVKWVAVGAGVLRAHPFSPQDSGDDQGPVLILPDGDILHGICTSPSILQRIADGTISNSEAQSIGDARCHAGGFPYCDADGDHAYRERCDLRTGRCLQEFGANCRAGGQRCVNGRCVDCPECPTPVLPPLILIPDDPALIDPSLEDQCLVCTAFLTTKIENAWVAPNGDVIVEEPLYASQCIESESTSNGVDNDGDGWCDTSNPF